MKITHVRVKSLGANKSELELDGGSTRVLFSYETPVAAYVPGVGYVYTRVHYSRTTSRHVSDWLGDNVTTPVDQGYIDNLLA